MWQCQELPGDDVNPDDLGTIALSLGHIAVTLTVNGVMLVKARKLSNFYAVKRGVNQTSASAYILR